jgi:hypothetical protein
MYLDCIVVTPRGGEAKNLVCRNIESFGRDKVSRGPTAGEEAVRVRMVSGAEHLVSATLTEFVAHFEEAATGAPRQVG